MPARPYLRMAVEDSNDEINELFTRATQDVLNEHWKKKFMSDITPSVSTRIKDQLKVKIAALPRCRKSMAMKNNPSGFPAVFITASDLDGKF
jgi:hypothetical protein